MTPPTQHAAPEAAPTGATDAVLKPSDPVPADAREVRGIDFNAYAQRPITVEELVGGYSRMGFQATAIGEAVRIVNDMVSAVVSRWRMDPPVRGMPGLRALPGCCALAKQFSRNGACLAQTLSNTDSARGGMPKQATAPPCSWATRPT